jgi:glycosyltransferase involved in cell wall biosynthesis
MAAHRLGVPSVHTVHSLLRPWPVFVAGAALSRSLSRHATTITAVSAATARDVARATGRTAYRVPNGIDLSEWRPTARPHARELHVVALTRLVKKKAPHVLLNALATSLPHVRRPIHLTIAGDGPERLRLERQAVQLGVGAQVTFRGACTRDEVRTLLADASVFIQAGRMEAFGLAVLEARASGVPVVAMRAGGVPELVEHERHGLLADTDAGLGQALAELCSNDARRARFAAAASRDLERFDWSRVLAGYGDVYRQAIERVQTSGRQAKKRAAATA